MVPIALSMCLCFTSALIIGFTWDENKPATEHKDSLWDMYSSAFGELKKREILTIGIVESLFQAVLNIFIFAWTPILQRTLNSSFNPGMIFICFVLMIILGTKLYEITIIHMKSNLYLNLTISLLVETLLFCYVYIQDSFLHRMVSCAIINGICGFYLPANSIIKAKILPEKYRSTLMSIFRIPLNFYVIAVLLYIKNMDPFNVSIYINIK